MPKNTETNDNTKAPAEENEKEKKTAQIIRLSSCAEWRKNKGLSLAYDVPYNVDAFLTGLDWTVLAHYETPPTIRAPKEKDASIQLVMAHVDAIARDRFGISEPFIRKRVANTVCYIANAIFEYCNVLVRGLQKTRVMPYHVEPACMLTDAIIGGFEYKGPPKINDEPMDNNSNAAESSTSSSNGGFKRERPADLDNTVEKSPAKAKKTTTAKKAAAPKNTKKTTTKSITSSKVKASA